MIEYNGKKFLTLEEAVRFLMKPGRIPGPQGDPGEPGEPGADGADGVGIASAVISAAGHLILVLTNGATIDCGSCVGPRGERGEPGQPGQPGKDGKDGAEYTFESPLWTDAQAAVHLGIGEGLKHDIPAGEIAVDFTQVQGKLIAGSNITITGNTISAAGGGGGSVAVKAPLDIEDDKIILKFGEGLTQGDEDELVVRIGSGIDTDNTGAIVPDYTKVQRKLTAGEGIEIFNNTVSFKSGEGLVTGDDDVIDVNYGDSMMLIDNALEVKYGAGAAQKQFYKHNVFLADTDGIGILAFSFLSQSSTPCTTVSQVVNSLVSGKSYVASGYELYCESEPTNIYYKVTKSGGSATAYASYGAKQITSTYYTLTEDSVEGIEG